MADEALYTLRQLAEQLGIPESTVRYYRDAFIDQIPSVGTGRRRRYPAQAIAVLRSIAKSYADGRPRSEIIAAVESRPDAPAPAVAIPSEKTQRAVSLEEVTNLDLLAAILDGEREQRDALWQMAKEIVRLTEVLDDQDKVLNEIADHAGVSAPGAPLLSGKTQSMLPAPEPSAPAPASPFSSAPPSSPSPPSPPSPPSLEHFDEVVVEPVPRVPNDSEMSRLRSELEGERALVERLRESKLQLEHRAADAEAALEERNKRRQSVIRRILGPDGK